jgi:hypothetical protein
MLLMKAGRAEIIAGVRDDRSSTLLPAFMLRRAQVIRVSYGLLNDVDIRSWRR